MPTSRRKFIRDSAKAATALASTPFSVSQHVKYGMTHHVFFWLKNKGSIVDIEKLLEGLKKLSKVKTIKKFYIGQPAGTNRPVIDNTYDISWLLFFKTTADQDLYQTDPIHLRFVEAYSYLWQKVTVYDSVEINEL